MSDSVYTELNAQNKSKFIKKPFYMYSRFCLQALVGHAMTLMNLINSHYEYDY